MVDLDVVSERLPGRGILLMGPPCGGKGEQTGIAQNFLRKRLFCPVNIFSPGQLFRQEVERDSLLGKRVESYLNRGLPVPDDVMSEVVRGFISHCDRNQVIWWDGFPRSRGQVDILGHEAGDFPSVVIVLEVDRKECRRRLISARRGRVDDSLEIFEQRYDLYENTLPDILDGVVGNQMAAVFINGAQSPAFVAHDIFSALRSWVALPGEKCHAA